MKIVLTLTVVLLVCVSCAAAQTSGTGYATWNAYYSGFSSSSVACSDGSNGIITRWGDRTIVPPLYPHITAWSLIPGWNSGNCRTCLELTTSRGSYFVSAVDHCGPPPAGYNSHFDLSPEAFTFLFGSTNVGTGKVQWNVVQDRNRCPGNKG